MEFQEVGSHLYYLERPDDCSTQILIVTDLCGDYLNFKLFLPGDPGCENDRSPCFS
jgi:hypothetical protein